MDEPIYVEIIGAHPHAGERGHIAVKDGMVTKIAPLGIGKPDMVLVTLEDCKHGESGCYAKQSNMRLLKG